MAAAKKPTKKPSAKKPPTKKAAAKKTTAKKPATKKPMAADPLGLQFGLWQAAERAYTRYGEYVGWTSVSGSPMPSWHALEERIQTAWYEAVRGVYQLPPAHAAGAGAPSKVLPFPSTAAPPPQPEEGLSAEERAAEEQLTAEMERRWDALADERLRSQEA